MQGAFCLFAPSGAYSSWTLTARRGIEGSGIRTAVVSSDVDMSDVRVGDDADDTIV